MLLAVALFATDAAATADAAHAWPPVFEIYAESKADLDAAIAQHPPFGGWFLSKISIHPIASCYHRENCGELFWRLTRVQSSLLSSSTQELKRQYVEETTAITRVRNAKRAIGELKLAENAIAYTATKHAFDVKIEAYERVRNYTKTYSHEEVEKPSKPAKLLEMLMFEKIANGLDDL